MFRYAVVLLALTTFAGCASSRCENWLSKRELLEAWIGRNLIDFERRYELRARSTAVRPQNRTEYSYVTQDFIFNEEPCFVRLTADNATGEIVDWYYEGNCQGRCGV
jgi:hypothetical protein